MNNDDFDYENAKRDIRDAGGDPDYLNHYNPAERDSFMRRMGFNPKDYGSKWEASGSAGKKASFFDDLAFIDDEMDIGDADIFEDDDLYNVQDYDDPESFYDDWYDEFEDYDEAELYWEEHHI